MEHLYGSPANSRNRAHMPSKVQSKLRRRSVDRSLLTGSMFCMVLRCRDHCCLVRDKHFMNKASSCCKPPSDSGAKPEAFQESSLESILAFFRLHTSKFHVIILDDALNGRVWCKRVLLEHVCNLKTLNSPLNRNIKGCAPGRLGTAHATSVTGDCANLSGS